ncbi:MAG: CDP-alcohol phosphatidyltransferase family protein [Acidimicrobiales bacterium]
MAQHPRGTYAEAIDRLASAQKGSRNAPAYSRWVNRPLGRRFAAAAYLAGLTPDRVTGISACFTFAGIGIVAATAPQPLLGVLISALLVIGYALDSADGQLARLRGGGTPRGEWLDHVTDAVKNASLHLAVVISWYRSGEAELLGSTSSALLLIPLAYAVVWSTQFYAKSLTDQLRLQHGGPAHPTTAEGVAEPAPWIGSLLTLPNDYGLLCLVFATIGIPALFTPLYLVLLVASTVFLVASLARWSRELRAHSGQHG